jgi:hypothetical protein
MRAFLQYVYVVATEETIRAESGWHGRQPTINDKWLTINKLIVNHLSLTVNTVCL